MSMEKANPGGRLRHPSLPFRTTQPLSQSYPTTAVYALQHINFVFYRLHKLGNVEAKNATLVAPGFSKHLAVSGALSTTGNVPEVVDR